MGPIHVSISDYVLDLVNKSLSQSLKVLLRWSGTLNARKNPRKRFLVLFLQNPGEVR